MRDRDLEITVMVASVDLRSDSVRIGLHNLRATMGDEDVSNLLLTAPIQLVADGGITDP